MEATAQIKIALDNIRHYSGMVNQLTKDQLNLDFTRYDMAESNGTYRLDLLGAFGSFTNDIVIRCDGMASLLKSAEALDSKLTPLGGIK